MTNITALPRHGPALLAAALLALSMTAGAQGGPPDMPAAGSAVMLQASDQQFIVTAAQDSMAKIELGRMAQQRAQDPQVKAYADRMVEDHSRSNDALLTIARTKGLEVPTTLDSAHRRDAERLQTMSGLAFDRAYMEPRVADHQQDIADYEQAARSARDSEVQGYAAITLPTLQSHLQMAQAAHDKVRNQKVPQPAGSVR